MKRTALTLLTTIYLLSGLGLGVNRYYCCGKLMSVTLTYGASEITNNATSKKGDCCKHEKQSFKIKDSHFSVVSSALNHPPPQLLPSFSSPENIAIASLLHTKIVYRGNAPPGHPDIPVYTLNCTYRI